MWIKEKWISWKKGNNSSTCKWVFFFKNAFIFIFKSWLTLSVRQKKPRGGDVTTECEDMLANQKADEYRNR